MDELELKKMVGDKLSTYQISAKVNKAQTTVRYWLKKYNLSTEYKSFEKKEYGDFRFCPRCQKDCDKNEFYQRRGKANSSVYCKICTSEQTIERQRRLKQELVDYKGGCCSKCGYDKYIGALEFHHLDPTEKDFTLAHLKLTSFNEKIKNELDKCILLCANCHREIHKK